MIETKFYILLFQLQIIFSSMLIVRVRKIIQVDLPVLLLCGHREHSKFLLADYSHETSCHIVIF